MLRTAGSILHVFGSIEKVQGNWRRFVTQLPLRRTVVHLLEALWQRLLRLDDAPGWDAQASLSLRDLNVERNDYSGPTRQLTGQALISGRVNSAACNLTKSCMLVGFWPVSLNRSSVIRS